MSNKGGQRRAARGPSVRSVARKRSGTRQSVSRKTSNVDVRTAPTTQHGKRADAPPLLKAFVDRTLKRGVKGCREEFQSIRGYQPNNMSIAAFQLNTNRNRYKDIKCLDQSRVLLTSYHTDYIHANWVIGGKLKYICTQAPTESTQEDFWQMVWQEEVVNVVMLCDIKENERVKCTEYFPTASGVSKTFGQYVICNTNVENKYLAGGCYVTINKLEVSNKRRGLEITMTGYAPRTVLHWWWSAWPDRGVPPDSKAVMKLRKKLLDASADQPVVVHCSAGIGRTGTLVMIDMLVTQIEANQQIDIEANMKSIRDQRASSVQTELQYLFAYKCALEYSRLRFGYIGDPKLYEKFNKELGDMK